MYWTAGKIFKTGPANTDNGEWLPKDAIPPTLLALLKIFFEEMWPVLQVCLSKLTAAQWTSATEMISHLPNSFVTRTHLLQCPL